MHFLGYLIFFCGTIISFVFASPKEPMWIYFSLGIILSVAGGVMVRFLKVEKKVEADALESITTPNGLLKVLELAESSLKSLVTSSDTLEVEKIKLKIEEIQDGILDFVENRELLKEEYGISAASEIDISFAGAERYLNRSWSALVDGAMVEMKLSLQIATDKFSKMLELFRKLIK